MIENIGDVKGFEYENVPMNWLEKKVNFCKHHLALQSKLSPGLSEYCAYMSGHCGEAMYWLYKKKYVAMQINGTELNQFMEKVAEYLFKVVEIWGKYRRRSSERLKAEDARSLIDIIEDKYVHTKFHHLA